MLVKKHRTLFGIFTSLILMFLICSIVTYKSQGTTEQVVKFEAEEYSKCENFGFDITKDEQGNIYFAKTDVDSWTAIAFPNRLYADWLFINFNRPVDPLLDIVIYYSVDGEAFNHIKAYAHADKLSSDKMTAIVPITNIVCDAIRIDIDSPTAFALKDIVFYDVKEISEPAYSLNVAVAIILAVIIALLCIFEKKLGYFDWIKNLVVADIAYFKELYAEKRKLALVLHGLMRFINIVFLFSIFTVFWASKMSQAKLVYMFVVSSITLVINVAEKLVTGSFATPERLFLITALIVGTMFSLCLPKTTFNVPDEEIHYETSLNIKTQLFGGKISFADMKMVWRYAANGDFMIDPEWFVYGITIDDAIEFDYSGRGNINLYNAIGYIPIAIMMALGDLLMLSYTQLLMFSKLVCIIIYSFVIALGIKRLKSGGYIVSAICLLPSSLILASSLTYDSWVMAFMTLGITYFISELQRPEKKLNLVDAAIMIGAVVLACGPKAVYFVLMIPFLFMPKTKFTSSKYRRNFIIVCCSAMALILISFMLPFLFDTAGATDYRGGDGVNASEQLKFILTSPFSYAQIVFRFLSDFLSFENMSNNITSHTYFGAPYTVYATILIFIIMFVCFTDKSKGDMFETRHRVKTIGFLSCVLAILLVVTALYIAFTPVQHSTINGVQFRYVFPIMPLFFYCIAPARVHSNIDRRVTQMMVYGVYSIVTVLVVYHVYIVQIYELLEA